MIGGVLVAVGFYPSTLPLYFMLPVIIALILLWTSKTHSSMD